MAELPMVLLILFVFLLVPLLIFVSLGYRSSILYFAADAANKKAAKAPTYTDATTRAASALTTNLTSFTGISAATPVISVLEKPLSGGAPVIYTSKLAPGSVDTSKNIYFIMSRVEADLSPLVQYNGGLFGMSVPGLTGPYHLTINTESYSENPSGLTE
ncbi:MAG: hypothetical protein JSS83_22425 [Cyanobacteria bacterium SZAS LIN-3]|nr:hypothetical protein [Cyanobacteria bacterium SZAS LIN-3]